MNRSFDGVDVHNMTKRQLLDALEYFMTQYNRTHSELIELQAQRSVVAIIKPWKRRAIYRVEDQELVFVRTERA